MYEIIEDVCVSLLPIVVNEMYHICSFFSSFECIAMSHLCGVICNEHLILLSLCQHWDKLPVICLHWEVVQLFHSLRQDWIFFSTYTTNIVIYFDVGSYQLLTVV